MNMTMNKSKGTTSKVVKNNVDRLYDDAIRREISLLQLAEEKM